MLKAFVQQSHGLTIVPLPASLQIPAEAIWLDLLDPTPAEEKAVEDFLRIDVPTREEMKEIETSNRLYEENGALYMTATVALSGSGRSRKRDSTALRPPRRRRPAVTRARAKARSRPSRALKLGVSARASSSGRP